MVEHHCRVCGLYIDTPPWGKDSNCPTHEICPCCNVDISKYAWESESLSCLIEIYDYFEKNITLKQILDNITKAKRLI